MSFDENDYSPAHLLGRTNVPRNLYPALRGSIRRSDPDGLSSTPYFADTNGKTLRITYTYENLGTVTEDQVDVEFSSNSFATIIETINDADPSNIEAVDQDGFLVVRNKNPGKTHRIEIEPWTVSADDAAPIFGFRVTPFPGSVSFAGEIASAPGIRTEGNPQGTALIGRDEDLASSSLNRPSASLLQLMQEILSELERDVIVYREVPVTLELHPITNSYPAAELTDDDLRLPIEMMGMEGETSGGDPGFAGFGRMEALFSILSDDGTHKELGAALDADTHSSVAPARVFGAFYATAATALNSGASFVAWGTPNGGSIYGPTVPNKNKHASTAITSIDGNIVYCSGATFVTMVVKKNDLVQISSPVSTSPFDHSGWFAVEKVIDEKHLALRPLAPSERIPAGGNRPRALNPSGLGNLRVAVGYFIPASSVWLLCDVIDGDGVDVVLRVATAVPLREALAEDFALGRKGTWQHLSDLLTDHLNGLSDRHAATQITGYTTSQWHDASTSTGGTLPETINDIISDLSAVAGGGGADRLGAGAINIGGATPNTIASGSIHDQLTALLTELRDQVNYNGSGPWADSTTIGAQNIETAIDQIVSDLAADDAGDDGAGKIGSESRSSGEVPAGTVASQLEYIAENWGKLSRPQIWTALNSFTSILEPEGSQVGDVNANPCILTGTGIQGGGSAKLLWEIQPVAGAYVRMWEYAGSLLDSGTAAFAITINADYTTSGDEWNADTPGQQASIFVITRNSIHLARKSATGAAWTDATWDTAVSISSVGEILLPSGTSIDSNGAITVAANQHVTTSGTGRHKHGAREIVIPACAWQVESTGSPTDVTLTSSGLLIISAASLLQVPINLEVGKRITNIEFEYDRNQPGGGSIVFTLRDRTGSTANTLSTLTGNSGGPGFVVNSFAVAPNYTMQSGYQVFLRADATAGGGGNLIINRVSVFYDD